MRASDPHRPARWACLLLMSASVAWGQDKDRDQEQLRRLRQQVQSLQQERQSATERAQRAQFEKAGLAEEVTKLRSAAGAQRGAVATLTQKLTALEKDAAALREEIDRLKAAQSAAGTEAAALRSSLAQRDAELAQSREERRLTETALARANEEGQRLDGLVDTCSKHNASLLRIGNELSDLLAGIGLWDRARASEPFLQLRRVQLENLSQTYREGLAPFRFTPASASDAKPGP